MVTQSAAAQHTHKISAWKEASAAQLAAASSYPPRHQEVEPSPVQAPSATAPVQPNSGSASGQESPPPALPPAPPAEAPPQAPEAPDEKEPGSSEPPTHTQGSDIDDILKRVIEEEREKAEKARAAAKTDGQAEEVLRVTATVAEETSP